MTKINENHKSLKAHEYALAIQFPFRMIMFVSLSKQLDSSYDNIEPLNYWTLQWTNGSYISNLMVIQYTSYT